ncbi:hypothetical protein [Gulosibacter hominis]|uniref:hypothetical protein n=1 Tax=Gulosibacter hominis TaxID=2770504 RepID=UPI001917E6CD|nr:hypothetical protein [Gulosibacter hominis]
MTNSKKIGYTVDQARAVFLTDTTFTAWGDINWHQHQTTITGEITVGHVPISNIPAMTFHIVLRPRRLSQPTFRVDLGGSHLQRIDVNGRHRGKQFTHLQQVDLHDLAMLTDPIDLTHKFPNVPHEPTISEQLLQRCYRDAANQFKIDIKGVTWTAPPIEGVII